MGDKGKGRVPGEGEGSQGRGRGGALQCHDRLSRITSAESSIESRIGFRYLLI